MKARALYSLLASLTLLSTVHSAHENDTPLPFTNVQCEGIYRHHLQGICIDESGAIYWPFTSTLVKTDAKGQVLKKVEVPIHHGDLCYHDGKIYVAVNLGSFNKPAGSADSWVYVYNADDLSLISKHPIPEVVHGAGGMAYHDGNFVVVGGLPEGVEENYAYSYTADFKFIGRHVIKSGYTRLGVQTLAFHGGHWWFGCYGKQLLKTDKDFRLEGRYDFDCGMGIVGISKGKFLIARGSGKGDERGGSVMIAKPDPDKGLVIEK